MTGIELDKMDLEKLKQRKKDPENGGKTEPEEDLDIRIDIPAHPATERRERRQRMERKSSGKGRMRWVAAALGLGLAAGIVVLILSITGVVHIPIGKPDPFSEKVSLREPRSLVVTSYRFAETMISLTTSASRNAMSSPQNMKKAMQSVSVAETYLAEWEKSVHNFTSGFMQIPREDAVQAEGIDNIRQFYTSQTVEALAGQSREFMAVYQELLGFCLANENAIKNQGSMERRRYDRMYFQFLREQKQYKGTYLRFLEQSRQLRAAYPKLTDYLPWPESHIAFWQNAGE